MRILGARAQVELTIHRSKFLGILEPVTDPEQARARLKDAKALYADASHVVHAFRTGPEGSETHGCSDDGEPSGTAGRPVLDVLKGAGGGNSLLLVVRWFGGVKLGTGGLVKAYGDTAKALVALAPWEELRAWVVARVRVGWTEHRPLLYELEATGAKVETEVFTDAVEVVARIPAEAFDELQRRTVDLTRGQGRWVRTDR